MTGRAPQFSKSVPDGDSQARAVCDHCGFVAYENPKIVVGSVVRHDGLILLCRRAIEPRRGFWTVPAGYLELHETPEAGAKREAREEACADLSISGLLAHYAVPHISQVQLIFRATLEGGVHAPGEESLETALVAFDDIPWSELAFPSVRWMLLQDEAVRRGVAPGPFSNPDDDGAAYFSAFTRADSA